MPSLDSDRNLAVIPLGSLDDDPGVRPMDHIYVAYKCEWYDITDDLPRYAEGLPSYHLNYDNCCSKIPNLKLRFHQTIDYLISEPTNLDSSLLSDHHLFQAPRNLRIFLA